MRSFKILALFVCVGLGSSLAGCAGTKIVDDKSDEIGPGDTKIYIVPSLKKEHQVRIEISADQDLDVVVGIADGEKLGQELGKSEKSKTAKFEVKIPADKEARIMIRSDKKTTVKTSIRSI